MIDQSRQDEFNRPRTLRTDLELNETNIASESLIGGPMERGETDLKRLNPIFAQLGNF